MKIGPIQMGGQREASWLDSLPDHLVQIGQDLLNVEVNTIIKPNMTARKMGELPNAIIAIAREYAEVMTTTMGIDLAAWWSSGEAADPTRRRSVDERLRPGKPRPAEFDLDLLTLRTDTFERLRWAAHHAAATISRDKDEQIVLLRRIQFNSADLVILLKALEGDNKKDNPWDRFKGKNKTDLETMSASERAVRVGEPDQINLVRKMWDVGTELVRIQTLVQLDGDVLTRVAPAVAFGKEQNLLAIHGESVTYALRHWEALFRILHALIGGRPRPPPASRGP